MITNVLPFLRQGDRMKAEKAERNEESKPRTVNLPAWLWEAIEKDADRCRRSITKQVEAILVCYYDPEANLELNRHALTEAFNVVSQKRMKA